ncbi:MULTISPECIES: hypothetical protein [Eubacteriales]|uniref:hypothetical protein n=1 Tax=Eubacteriales TaxID=186802 RepID=UPI001F2EFF30|nr:MULTISPECIES: hypothetical protein [Eubacteriales]MCF6466620.1 hypothetical protein [Clostridium sp. Cult2]WIV12811.1 hypothetical protein QO263_03600 [Proteiniborus sp. MB09-C3]
MFYTNAGVYSIDPRDIGDEIVKVKLLKKLGQNADLDVKELNQVKDIASITEPEMKNSKDNTSSSKTELENIEPFTPLRNEVVSCETDSSQNPEYYFMNISDAQLYWLKQKFDKV